MGFTENKNSLAAVLILMGPVASLTARAEVYMSSEQATQVFFPGQVFKKTSVELSNDEKNKIEAQSGAKVRSNSFSVFKSKEGNVIFVDQVIGKHELITYAVGLSKDATIKGVEILEYRESYGHQIKKEAWRNQFVGKDKSAALKINQDIKNISGATLSSTHVTEGIRRILQTYDQIKTRI